MRKITLAICVLVCTYVMWFSNKNICSSGRLEASHSIYFANSWVRNLYNEQGLTYTKSMHGTAWFFHERQPYIITNYHVVDTPAIYPKSLSYWWEFLPDKYKKILSWIGKSTYTIGFKSCYTFVDDRGKRFPCKLMYSLADSQNKDAAALRVRGIKAWMPFPIGDPESVKIGDIVSTIGTTWDEVNLRHYGRVSETHYQLDRADKDTLYFVSNAKVIPGYSGGPFLDAEDKAIGINTCYSTFWSNTYYSIYINEIDFVELGKRLQEIDKDAK